MGNGMCSRKQKRIFQTLLLLTVVFGFLYGAMLYYELQTQLRKAEAVALKYQQHQESLSAQLQVGDLGFTFPGGGTLVKNLPASAGDAGDVGSIPQSGRSPGVGNGNPLQYSCLGNPMDRAALWAIVYGVAKETELDD